MEELKTAHQFKRALAELFNQYGIDHLLNTPDYILAELVDKWLDAERDAQLKRLRHGDTEWKLRQALQSLDRIETLLINNQLNVKTIMSDLTQLTQDVQDEITVEESAIVLLEGLKAKLDEAGTDPAKLAALSKSLQDEKAKLAAAITANTPADPNASPAPGEGAEGDTKG